ncbi:hypothetical protein ACFLQU_05915, partial [Verrucomicrobiota bacterium]
MIRADEEFFGSVLRWNSALGRTYSIWRSNNLKEGFERLHSGIPGVPPRNLHYDPTATNNVP